MILSDPSWKFGYQHEVKIELFKYRLFVILSCYFVGIILL